MEKTEKLGLNLPERGYKDWDIPINENFRILDTVDSLPAQAGQGGKFLKTDGTTASWGEIGGGLEIGDIGFAPLGIDETQNKRRYLNGQVISQTQFVSFTNKIKSAIELYPNLATSETNWQATVTNSKLGQCGKFVIDDNAGTIRLPKVVNINGLIDLSALGGIKAESLPNIKGRFTVVGARGAGVPSGAFVGKTGNIYEAGTGSETTGVLQGFDASLSSSTYQDNAPVQQEAVQYPYFIQVATGSEESVDVSTEIQLNNPFFFGMSQWFESEPNNASWLISNGSYHSGATYASFYEWLLKVHNGTLTVDGVSVKAYGASGITDYDYVINTADTTFRLPIKVKLASGNAVVGNGMTLGFYNGSTYAGLKANGTDGLEDSAGLYGTTVGTTNNAGGQMTNSSGIGVTTDPTKSGIETSSSGLYLYFYVGETVQDANVINAAGVLTRVANSIDRTVASDRETVVGWGMPDYSAGVSVSSGYIAVSDGWIKNRRVNNNGTFNLSINGITMYDWTTSGAWYAVDPGLHPVKKGDVIKFNGIGIFYPCKGVN